MAVNESLQVTDEFIQQNLEHAQIKKSHKKGGPYSKNDRDKRREEVNRLHSDYGYSARKIADLMKISRNTINGDLDYWYSKISKNVNMLNLESDILTMLERMQVQRTRLREQLDKVETNSERMAIERLIFDINSKIAHISEKLAYSAVRTDERVTEAINSSMKKNNMSDRVVSYFDIISVSEKAQQRIKRILNEDMKKGNIWRKF